MLFLKCQAKAKQKQIPGLLKPAAECLVTYSLEALEFPICN